MPTGSHVRRTIGRPRRHPESGHGCYREFACEDLPGTTLIIPMLMYYGSGAQDDCTVLLDTDRASYDPDTALCRYVRHGREALAQGLHAPDFHPRQVSQESGRLMGVRVARVSHDSCAYARVGPSAFPSWPLQEKVANHDSTSLASQALRTGSTPTTAYPTRTLGRLPAPPADWPRHGLARAFSSPPHNFGALPHR